MATTKERSEHPLKLYLQRHQIKLVWLAEVLGISDQLLRHHLQKRSLTPEQERKAAAAIRAKGRALASFGKRKLAA